MTRELDALIAEHVMGWEKVCISTKPAEEVTDADWAWIMEGTLQFMVYDWRPSTFWGYAGMVVEKIGHEKYINIKCAMHDGTFWRVGLYGDDDWVAEAPTAPQAICLAALKAVNYEGELE